MVCENFEVITRLKTSEIPRGGRKGLNVMVCHTDILIKYRKQMLLPCIYQWTMRFALSNTSGLSLNRLDVMGMLINNITLIM